MQNRNRVAVIGNFREIFANVVLQGELGLFFQQQNTGGGELFRCRADVKNSLRRDRYAFFDIREPVPVFVDDLSASRH